MIKTRGMVLSRNPYREYDEKIHFYTEHLGKVWVYAFGSRSSRSLRGQGLAQLGWLDLELEKKGSRYLLKELTPGLIPDYYRNKKYFLSWTEFLKLLSKKIPGAQPTPEIFSLLCFLSGPEPAHWEPRFREFTWYSSTLLELGFFPDFSHCQHCRKYCSDWYFFSLPGEIVGSSCISQLKSHNIHIQNWFSDQLALEDVYFLNYCQHNYFSSMSKSKFFTKIFALADQLSAKNKRTKETNSSGLIRQERELSIHWDRILPIFYAVLEY